MEETLKQMVGKTVTAILQYQSGVSLSIRGELEAAFGRYHIPGNPAAIFGFHHVLSIDPEHSIIRLTV